MDCHTGKEMHADATNIGTRFDLPERPRCEKCHPEVISQNPKTRAHQLHKGQVACQVCHALANKNCFGCHVGTDKKGLPYFKCEKTEMLFKIGRNPNKTDTRPYAFVVLRHPPADPGLFDFYVENGLANFSALPTWKLDTPHTIQRKTPQNSHCNHCHGNPSLFLLKRDVAAWEQNCNMALVVPEANVPRPVREVMKNP
jgi:thiosulfate/3-mercaptopyruvate sulfurtransferase